MTDNRIPACIISAVIARVQDNVVIACHRFEFAAGYFSLNFANIEPIVVRTRTVALGSGSRLKRDQMALQLFNGQFRSDNEILARPCKIEKIEANPIRCDYIDRVERV